MIAEIKHVLPAVDASKHRTKVSKAKTMRGKALYSPIAINAAIKKGFERHGWAESRTSYWVTSDYDLIQLHHGVEAARAEGRY